MAEPKDYRVGVTDRNVGQGLGPRLIMANDPESAKKIFAQLEGTTVKELEEMGNTWWQIEEAPRN